MTIGTLLHLKLFYRFVGDDEYGNRYYQAKHADENGFFRRMVRYAGTDEPTAVPPHWHSWLHHLTDEVPPRSVVLYRWQRKNTPNCTGTLHAYYPPGHILAGGKRKKATGDYKPWQPS